MANLILIILVIVLHSYWIYKVATYDWDNFDEDGKDDDFLKPIDK